VWFVCKCIQKCVIEVFKTCYALVMLGGGRGTYGVKIREKGKGERKRGKVREKWVGKRVREKDGGKGQGRKEENRKGNSTI
jgi:hypothetical protein